MQTPLRLRTVCYRHELEKILFLRGHSLEDLQILRQYIWSVTNPRLFRISETPLACRLTLLISFGTVIIFHKWLVMFCKAIGILFVSAESLI